VYEVANDGAGHGYDVTCAPGTSKTFDTTFTQVAANPFVVYTSAVCGPVGLTEQRLHDALLDRLSVAEQGTVESVFSQQANGQSPGLANSTNPGAVTLTAVTTITAAISSLEGWLYQTKQYGLPGIIHAPSVASSYFREVNSMMKDGGGVWRTPQGTAISLGNYSGLTLAGGAPAAGHTTLYITGQMAIWRDSQANVLVTPYGPNLNRATNQLYGLSERGYVVSIDNFVAAIDVILAI